MKIDFNWLVDYSRDFYVMGAGEYDSLKKFTNDLNNADQSELLEFISSDFKQLEIGTLQPLHAEVQMNFENFQFLIFNTCSRGGMSSKSHFVP